MMHAQRDASLYSVPDHVDIPEQPEVQDPTFTDNDDHYIDVCVHFL
jgi:hypothetical protein